MLFFPLHVASPIAHSVTFQWGSVGVIFFQPFCMGREESTSQSDQYLMVTREYQERRFIIECPYLFLVKGTVILLLPMDDS